MEHWIEPLIGNENHAIAWWQVGIRTLLMFIIAWILIRIAGIRTFGKRSALDIITLFMLGSVLARAIAGTVPFFPTVLAGTVLVSLHRLLAVLIYHNKRLGELIKGKNVIIFEDGSFDEKKMRKLNITKEEVEESIRRCLNTEDVGEVDKIYFEPSGRISVIRKSSR